MGYAHGTQWSEELITDKINRVIHTLGLNRFPTQHEMRDFYGNYSLAVKISKTGGAKYWANKMGYVVKRCESEFGEHFEMYVINDIRIHTGLESYKTKTRYPYDIVTNKHIKVDVKSSTINKNKQGYSYFSFNLEKREPTCDIYLLYCINDSNEPYKTLIVPSCYTYGQTQICITANKNSKWDKYKNNWKLFDLYNKFYADLLERKSMTM